MKKISFIIAGGFALIGMVAGTVGVVFAFGEGEKKESPLEKVSILLDWTPNTNHLGAYVAREKGWFADEGLDVSIDRSTQQSVEALVGSGKSEFGYSYQEGTTLARAAKSPVSIVALAAVIQHNTSGFAALRSSGINSPKNFEGKKYSAFGSPMEKLTLRAVMKPVGANVEKVKFVPGGQIDFFQGIQSGLFDFSWVFEGWTGIEAKNKNIDLLYLPLAKLDDVFDYYTPIIIASEKYIEEHPDTVTRFMRALTKGYEWSVKNPAHAAKILVTAEPSIDETLAVESAKFLAGQFINDAATWGEMKPIVWERYTAWLQEQGLVPKDFSIEGAFTNDFLDCGCSP